MPSDRSSRRALPGVLISTTVLGAVVVLALLAVMNPPSLDSGGRSRSTSELGIEVSRSVRDVPSGSAAAGPTAPIDDPGDAGTVGQAASLVATPSPEPPAGSFVTPGRRLGIAGCDLFPRDNVFRAHIGRLRVADDSDRIIAAGGGASTPLSAGFSARPWDGARAGYPVNIADSRETELTSVIATAYPDASDLDGHPLPSEPRIEGWPSQRWDRHLLVVDPATCRSHEMIGVRDPSRNVLGAWFVDKAVTVDLGSNHYRSRGTVKVAGVSMLAGLIRYDEVVSGNVGHVVSISLPGTGAGQVWPARMSDGTNQDPDAPSMGTWLRLRADVDLSALGPQARVIAQALRDHGGIVTDTGGRFALSGEPDVRWDDADLRTLRSLTLDSFEVVDPAPMMASADSLRIR